VSGVGEVGVVVGVVVVVVTGGVVRGTMRHRYHMHRVCECHHHVNNVPVTTTPNV